MRILLPQKEGTAPDTTVSSCGGRSLCLGNREFQMLELLMRQQGRVITTEQFMERIWGYDSDVEMNVVWVYISYLRKKLSALHADIQIKATRNAGYSLEECQVRQIWPPVTGSWN